MSDFGLPALTDHAPYAAALAAHSEARAELGRYQDASSAAQRHFLTVTASAGPGDLDAIKAAEDALWSANKQVEIAERNASAAAAVLPALKLEARQAIAEFAGSIGELLTDELWEAYDTFLVKLDTIAQLRYQGKQAMGRLEVGEQEVTFIAGPKGPNMAVMTGLQEWRNGFKARERRETSKRAGIEARLRNARHNLKQAGNGNRSSPYAAQKARHALQEAERDARRAGMTIE